MSHQVARREHARCRFPRAGKRRINRTEARSLASAEFEKFAALAASLSPDEWATDTDCVGWDVRKMVLHVLGSADAQSSRWSSCTNCVAVFR
jgi:hypothetical protein